MNEPKPPLHERGPPSGKDSTPDRLTIQFDAREYAHFLADSDLTEAQKLEYIETIWTIVLHFIDMGFGIHPLQQACGQFSESPALCADADSIMVESSHSEFCKLARADETPCVKRIPYKHEGEKP